MTNNNILLVSIIHNRLRMLLWPIIGYKWLIKRKVNNKIIQFNIIKNKTFLPKAHRIPCFQTHTIAQEIKGNKQSQIKRFIKILKVIKKSIKRIRKNSVLPLKEEALC